MSDLIAGAWRNGLTKEQAKVLEYMEDGSGLVTTLAGLLDGYDELVGELLTSEGA